MRSTRTLWVAVGAAAAVTLVGSAFAQTPPTDGMHRSVLTRAAAELGVPEQRLADALARGHEEALAEAVASGQLTRAQADAMVQHHRAITQQGVGTLPGIPGHVTVPGIRGHVTMAGMTALGASAHGVTGQGMTDGAGHGAMHGGDGTAMGRHHGAGGAPPVR